MNPARGTLGAALVVLAACGPSAPRPYDPSVLEPAIPEVLAALRAGEPARALAELERLRVAGGPQGLDHYLGLALADAGRPDEAVAAFARELAVHPGNASAHALAAESLLGLGRLDEAQEHLTRAAGLAPTLPWLPWLAGRVALARGDDARAAAGFRAYLAHDRTSTRAAEAHHALALLAARADLSAEARAHEAASERLEKAHKYLAAFHQRLREDPRDLSATLGVGMVHLSLYREVDPDPAQLEQAERALAAALALDPRNVKALLNLGYVRLVAGRNEEAQALLERAREVDPGHSGVLLNLGLLARSRGEAALALQHLQAAAGENAPPDERLRALLACGEILAEQGRREEARACYRQALALDPSDPLRIAARLEALAAP